VEVRDTESGRIAIAFVDDTLLLARGKMLAEANDKVKGMMERAGVMDVDGAHATSASFAVTSSAGDWANNGGGQLLQGPNKQGHPMTG